MFTRERKRVISKQGGVTKCQRHLAGLCDVNNIVARAMRGDVSMIRSGGQYADLSNMPADLHSALNLGKAAEAAWSSLPDDLKKIYATPEALLHAIQDDSQREVFERNGMLEKAAEAVKVEVVNNPSPVEGGSVVPDSVER